MDVITAVYYWVLIVIIPFAWLIKLNGFKANISKQQPKQ